MSALPFRLSDTLSSMDGWEIIETSFQQSDPDFGKDSIFMVGNGYVGYRGTFAEATAEQGVSCIVSDTFDGEDGSWKELCNAPNLLEELVQRF